MNDSNIISLDSYVGGISLDVFSPDVPHCVAIHKVYYDSPSDYSYITSLYATHARIGTFEELRDVLDFGPMVRDYMSRCEAMGLELPRQFNWLFSTDDLHKTTGEHSYIVRPVPLNEQIMFKKVLLAHLQTAYRDEASTLLFE